MKEKTILALRADLLEMKDKHLSVKEFCAQNNKSSQSFYDKIAEYKKTTDVVVERFNEIIGLYNSIKRTKTDASYAPIPTKDVVAKICEEAVEKCSMGSLFPEMEIEEKGSIEEEIDSDDRTQVSYTRNENGNIIRYNYCIYRKGKDPLEGFLTREETSLIYNLYSAYGENETQKEVSKRFPQFSIQDVKRLFKAFGIYKANSPFPQHMLEEFPEAELVEIQLRKKEANVLNKLEIAEIKHNEKLVKKYIAENANLQRQLDNVSKIKFEVLNTPKINFRKIDKVDNNFINLYLADMHIGASMGFAPLYSENIRFGYNELERRLSEVINNIRTFGTFDHINICLVGDMMDCCGPTNKTARLDHDLPENMDGYEQANGYITLITNFVRNIASLGICKHINMYSVRSGNHTGVVEYVATKALFATLQSEFISTTLFDTFFGTFKEGDSTFILTHGKDDKFMKRGMPLNIDDKNKVLIYEWLDDQGITGDNIHFIKGDLHSSNYNSCKKFDYRNVLSLFGSSDYSAYNFSRNSYGVSYDLCLGNNLVRGDFQNI